MKMNGGSIVIPQTTLQEGEMMEDDRITMTNGRVRLLKLMEMH